MSDLATKTPLSKYGHSPAARAEREARREQVSVLLLARVPYRQIAERVGAAYSTVRDDVAAIQRQWQARYAENYQAHVAEMMATYDALKRTWLPRSLGSNPDGDAADRVLKIERERARLLGTDAPVKVRHEVLTEDAIDAAIRDLVVEMDEQAGAAVH